MAGWPRCLNPEAVSAPEYSGRDNVYLNGAVLGLSRAEIDARFQLKCARTIDRFIDEGRTLLFVSHDLNSVKRVCNRATLLDGGRILYLGRPNSVANLYSN